MTKSCVTIFQREKYIIYENDVRAGLLICQKGNIAFLRGYRITDKVILPAFVVDHCRPERNACCTDY